MLYNDLPWPILGIFMGAALIIVASLVSSVVLLRQGHELRSNKQRRDQAVITSGFDNAASEYAWIVLVPALNEEVTIADTVEHLAHLRATHRAILVVDDASEDATAEILNSLDIPELEVLHRTKPHAQLGKAAALNDAYRHIHQRMLAPGGRFAGWSPERVIVAVVDADGRLDARAPLLVGPQFVDSRVGGVQVSVHIYNRSHPLAWMQHAEFGIIGQLQQMGRSGWGTAGMGGNGQFNRLLALDTVVGDWVGPWRDTLTEDQDLGLRLIARGWRNTHEDATFVEQQGLSSVRRLYRQRTRWAQGNFQAISHSRDIAKAQHISRAARADLLFWLATPLAQLFVGLCSLVAIGLAISGVPFAPEGQWRWVAIFVVLGVSIGSTVVGLLARSRGMGASGVARALALTLPYAVYAWFMWPVLLRALWRQVRGATTWAKTDREPLQLMPTSDQSAAIGSADTATLSIMRGRHSELPRRDDGLGESESHEIFEAELIPMDGRSALLR